jgi:Icc-related predicted phosphoesterase
MTILAVADLHYSLPQFDWLQEHASGYDVVVVAGDTLDMGSAVDLDVQAIVVQKYLRQCSRNGLLLVSSGNHDFTEKTDSGERIAAWLDDARGEQVRIDWESVEKDGVLFTVCPWWDGPETQARTEAHIEADSLKPRTKWVWVHHAPPDDSPVSWTGKRFGGDKDLIAWIERYQPDVVLSGHIHNAPFYDGGSWHSKIGRTVIFNAGKQIGGVPTQIRIDFEKNSAEWHSIEGIETLPL